jgi:hypothetical protein
LLHKRIWTRLRSKRSTLGDVYRKTPGSYPVWAFAVAVVYS